jgi:hypothetical protein
MRLLNLAAGAALIAMGSAAAASTGPATTAEAVERVVQPILSVSHGAASFGISADDKVETPLIRTAAPRHW